MNLNDEPFILGSRIDAEGNHFLEWEGALDDLGIWSRDLSDEEALELYLSSAPNAGCIDFEACNYNPEANWDDGSCLELDACGECGGEGVAGCITPEACNYDPIASCDDGSCIYTPSIDLGDDIETCEESVTLDAGAGYDSYLWSTGETTQTIEVNESGEYGVEVANEISNN